MKVWDNVPFYAQKVVLMSTSIREVQGKKGKKMEEEEKENNVYLHFSYVTLFSQVIIWAC